MDESSGHGAAAGAASKTQAMHLPKLPHDGVLDAGPEVRDGEKIDQEFLSVGYP